MKKKNPHNNNNKMSNYYLSKLQFGYWQTWPTPKITAFGTCEFLPIGEQKIVQVTQTRLSRQGFKKITY